MKLVCHSLSDDPPPLRAAPSKRDWMDATPESYAYRCLPLTIANSHGWEVLNTVGFAAEWNGKVDKTAITLTFDDDKPLPTASYVRGMSHFGSGVITFDGEPPKLKPHDTKVKPADYAVCGAQEVPDESLVVNAENKGIAHVFVYLQKAPAGAKPQPRGRGGSRVPPRAAGAPARGTRLRQPHRHRPPKAPDINVENMQRNVAQAPSHLILTFLMNIFRSILPRDSSISHVHAASIERIRSRSDTAGEAKRHPEPPVLQ